MTRWKAAGIHLLLSALVIGAIAAWVLSVWFPPALLPMSGIAGLILLIAVVDLTLGPFLTLVVYKAGKPSLRFDLAVIVLLQIGMLGYGLYTLAQNRPIFLVAAVDRLDLVMNQEVSDADLALAPKPEWQRRSWTGPVRVGARLPVDQALREALMFDGLAGRDVQHQPRFYSDFNRVWPDLAQHVLPLVFLESKLDEGEKHRLARAIGRDDMGQWGYLPVNGVRGAALILVDEQGRPDKFVAIDPYAATTR